MRATCVYQRDGFTRSGTGKTWPVETFIYGKIISDLPVKCELSLCENQTRAQPEMWDNLG